MYSYKDIVSFARSIDKRCADIVDWENHLARNESIQSWCEGTATVNGELNIDYNAEVTRIGSIGIGELFANFKYDELDKLVIELKRDIAFLEQDITNTKKTLELYYINKNAIENHESFKSKIIYKWWIWRSNKYIEKFFLPKSAPNGLHDFLFEYTQDEIARIIKKGIFLLNFEKSKLNSAWLYNVYCGATNTDGYINQMKDTLTSYENAKKNLEQFCGTIIENTKKAINHYEDLLSADHYAEISKSVDIENLISQISALKNNFKDWRKNEIQETALEKYCFFERKGVFKNINADSERVQNLKERFFRDYNFIFKVEGDKYCYTFPEIINVNSNFKYVIDASKACDDKDREIISSFAQNFVANTLANFPAGKTKFLFCDPLNKGVFSIFRDIGKLNDNSGISSFCEYASSQKDTEEKFDSICQEITLIVNQILNDPTETLYDHNRNNEFNVRPYKFIIIMDFPGNMNASSLFALKNNIISNGPRCGIFTVIINMNQEAMNLLNDKERAIAKEIVNSFDFKYVNRNLYDNYNNIFEFPKEYTKPDDLNLYAEIYNKKAKNGIEIKIDIDSLNGKVINDGNYNIPIGKSTGGKTESIAFFDSCQNYLMSGAVGQGKSNALHVIIHNSLKYIKNLDLYLVDFKYGVEFAQYANMNHPAFKVLAIEAAPEFGYSVLNHINDKITKIGEIFIENNVSTWQELYEKTKDDEIKKIIPPTLVVIDEFQYLFEGEHANDCTRIIEYIARVGRAFNVHLILSTQLINNLNGLNAQAKQAIFGRIVFFNNDAEYDSMLWNDIKLAKTITSDSKGLAVVANGQTVQKMVKFAMKKPIEETVKEFTQPLSGNQSNTKIMISYADKNPYSIYNLFINGKYEPTEYCNLFIGDSIKIKPSDIKERLNDPEYVPNPDDNRSYIQLKNRQNDNVLVIGNDPSKAENIFIFSLICTLIKQVSQEKTKSITLITIDTASDLCNFANNFPEYIKIYTQLDMLSDAVTEKTEYLFVFGLQSFTSMRFSFNNPYAKVANPAQAGGIMIGGNAMNPTTSPFSANDGEMFRQAIDNTKCNVLVWHNDVNNLANMFGNPATFGMFNDRFLHKIGLKMNSNDSVMFIGSGSCDNLSDKTAIYKCINNEVIIHVYKKFDTKYRNDIVKKLNEIIEKSNNEK